MCSRLFFYTLEVRTVASVDADLVADVAEEGHTYFGAGLYSSGFEGVCGCIAFDAGLGVCDLEHCFHGHLGIEHCVGRSIAYYFYHVAFFHEIAAGHELLVDRNLLESLLVHEDIIATVGIEILIGTTLYANVFEFLADIEATLEHAAVDHVLKFGAHEGVAFTGLYVEELHAEVQAPVHADAGAVLDVLCVNHIYEVVVLAFELQNYDFLR